MFPVLPGREQQRRVLAAACVGERRKGFEGQMARGGRTRETWSLQETPVGSLLVWFEDPEVGKAFTALATSDDEFTVWFRGQVKDVTGVDLGAPPESPPRRAGRQDRLKNSLLRKDVTNRGVVHWGEALSHVPLLLISDKGTPDGGLVLTRLISGRRQVHRDAVLRPRPPARCHRRPDAVAPLADGGVGQPDHGEGGQSVVRRRCHGTGVTASADDPMLGPETEPTPPPHP
jgi:hypothetical protein